MVRTSANESSRAITTRLTPNCWARAMPSALVMLICVLPWTARSGAILRASWATATSWTITESAPAAAISASASVARLSSWSKTSVLKVT